MSTLPKSFVTPEEYLELERKVEYKSEYYNGEIFARFGASRRHNTVAMHLYGIMDRHLRARKCHGYPSDMRILAPDGLYTYPDFSATCDEPRYADTRLDTLVNPALIVEVLSPSTKAYDRGRKARLYRSMPSLKELLLIAQDQYEVELHRRREDGTWMLLNAVGLEASIELMSIGCTLQLGELYENIPEE
ncbi:MAG: Uma2 family endonuclease [Candidatus Sulfopaludibacter sp.]|nr:Uma2 family endonuclease [Candidatus Sulfopaludibacter sp.]